MRLALSVMALALATGAAAEPPRQAPLPGIVAPDPDPRFEKPESRVPCRDTIRQVREERGLPQVRRETASPDEPLLIAAVDHRINGCSVMVMRGNTSDVRPLPAAREGQPLLQRISGG